MQESKLAQPLWKTVWRCLEKLNIELPWDPAIPPLGIYPKKNVIQKDKCTPLFIVALFKIAKTWKKPKYHGKMNGYRRCSIHTQWNTTQT